MKREFRLLVCGARDATDQLWVDFHLGREIATHAAGRDRSEVIVIHGAAPGIDTLAHRYCTRLGFHDEAFPADWQRHGRAAGPIRNAEMLAAGVDRALVFAGGPGTRDMMRRLFDAGVPFRYVGRQPNGQLQSPGE